MAEAREQAQTVPHGSASEPERGAAWKLGAALIVVAATIAMSIGIFAAVVGMWLPRIV